MVIGCNANKKLSHHTIYMYSTYMQSIRHSSLNGHHGTSTIIYFKGQSSRALDLGGAYGKPNVTKLNLTLNDERHIQPNNVQRRAAVTTNVTFNLTSNAAVRMFECVYLTHIIRNLTSCTHVSHT